MFAPFCGPRENVSLVPAVALDGPAYVLEVAVHTNMHSMNYVQ